MQSWTGLVGDQDKVIRVTGKEYIIFEGVEMIPQMQVVENFENAYNNLDWDEWCYVCAESEEMAKERFYDAHDQWSIDNEGFD